MGTHALKRAIKIAGGQSALARDLSVLTGKRIRQGNVWSWLMRTKRVPPEVAPYIERITADKGEMVPRSELCPDFPWEGIQVAVSAAIHDSYPSEMTAALRRIG